MNNTCICCGAIIRRGGRSARFVSAADQNFELHETKSDFGPARKQVGTLTLTRTSSARQDAKNPIEPG